MNFSDVSEVVPAPTPEPARRRGRPRSTETIARDERVLAALRASGVQSRDQLVAALGLTPNMVYLSLWRLKHQQLVERVTAPETRHAWRATA
jgi:predicted ArsR family transcriptional regulator